MEKNYAELSMMDAFKALKDIGEEFDDQIRKQYGAKLNPKRSRALKEAVDVSVTSTQEAEAAQKELDDAETKNSEITLKVIDVDADTVDHLKKDKDYIGQMILQCKVCKALKFIDADSLKASEEDAETVNIEDECPNCHESGKGYSIIGQVGKAEEEEETIEVENDESAAEEDATIENDVEEEETVEDTSEEESPEGEGIEVEETDSETFEEEPEVAFDETTESEEEEEEDLPSLGEEIEEDHKEDDTIEEEVEEEEEIEEKEDIEEAFEEPEFKSNFNSKLESVESLIECFIEGSDLDDISCVNGDEDVVYKGHCDSLPTDLRNSKLVKFDTCGGDLIINIDLDCPGDVCLRDFLDKFGDDDCENISLVDSICDSEVYCGNKKGAIDKYGDCAIWSVEKPKAIQCVTDYCGKQIPWSEEEDEVCDEDDLICDIIKKNGLRPDKVTNPKCAEYWIAESIKNGEDLDVIYEGYIKGLDESIINTFKTKTGYKDAVDIALQEELNETIARNDDVESAKKLAEEDLEVNSAYAVIYGYFSRGKFYQLPSNIICRDDKELQLASEMVRSKYRVSGSIYTVYGNKNESLDDFSREDIEAEQEDINQMVALEEMRHQVEDWAKADVEAGTILEDKDSFSIFCKASFGKDYREDAHLNDLWDWYCSIVEDTQGDVELSDEEIIEIIDDEDGVDEALNEEAELKAASRMLNDGADKVDKALTDAGIECKVVTSTEYPTVIGVMATDEDSRTKAKNIVTKVFDSLGWKANEIKDIDEEGVVGITYDKISLVQPVGAVKEEGYQYFKNRKELSEAIKSLKAQNKPYVVSKSLKEGYRYALLTEQLKKWEVSNLDNGEVLGIVEAEDEAEAYDVACGEYGDRCADEDIIVDEVVEEDLGLTEDWIYERPFNEEDFYNIETFQGTVEQANQIFDQIKNIVINATENPLKEIRKYIESIVNGELEELKGCFNTDDVTGIIRSFTKTVPAQYGYQPIIFNQPEEEGIYKNYNGKLAWSKPLSVLDAEREAKHQARLAAEAEAKVAKDREKKDKINARAKEKRRTIKLQKIADILRTCPEEIKAEYQDRDLETLTEDEERFILSIGRLEEGLETVREQQDKLVELTEEDIKTLVDATTSIYLTYGAGKSKNQKAIARKTKAIEAYGRELFGESFDKAKYQKDSWGLGARVHFAASEKDEVAEIIERCGLGYYLDTKSFEKYNIICRIALAEVLIQNGAADKVSDTRDPNTEEFLGEIDVFLEDPDSFEEEVEFKAEQFDDELNEYFKNTYGEEVVYESVKGEKDLVGNILIEGNLIYNGLNKEVKFLFQPISEDLDKPVYQVRNNLSDEVFEFCEE